MHFKVNQNSNLNLDQMLKRKQNFLWWWVCGSKLMDSPPKNFVELCNDESNKLRQVTKRHIRQNKYNEISRLADVQNPAPPDL